MRANQTFSLRIVCALAFLLLFFSISQPALAQSQVTLQFRDIQVQPNQGLASYDVSVYFSLLDSARNPIKDATMGDFTASEDNQPVKITKLGVENEPINVAILLDTSGSMAGDKIDAARSAASSFIENLQSNDQVAVLTFDKSVKPLIDFTLDHKAARQQVAIIPEPTPYTTTCLFDAAYATIKQAGALTNGQRAIILLTDGQDLGDDNIHPCSSHKLADVTKLATSGKTPIPIYTIGLGEKADTRTLQSLADQTNGRYQYSPRPNQLEALFSLIQDELRSQYGLHYTSTASAGKHTLTLHVKYQSAEDEVSGRMEMPVLPYVLTFISPAEAAEVTGGTRLSVEVSGGDGTPIQKIQFLANQTIVGSDATPPYEFTWVPSGLNAGSVSLEAVAQDAGGNALVRSNITVSYKPIPVVATPAPTLASVSQGGKLSFTSLLLAAAAGLVLIGAVVAVLLAARKHRKPSPEPAAQPPPILPDTAGAEDHTMDIASTRNTLGALIVLQSDEAAMHNQRIEINHPLTHLGRKADNDVIFAKDSPVSRRHAVLEARDGQVFLSEVIAKDEQTGQPKRPAYGTFVNGSQVQEPVLLHDGDEITLGKRLRLRFEAIPIALAGDDRTLDVVGANPDDKTVAAFTADKTVSSTSDEKMVIAGSAKEIASSVVDDKTIPSPTGQKTVVARIDDMSKTSGDIGKTFIPGAGQK